MKNKTIKKTAIFLIILAPLLLAVCFLCRGKSTWLNTTIDGNISSKQPRLEDDFIQSINYDFLKNTPIPDSKISVSKAFSAYDDIKSRMLSYVKDINLDSEENLENKAVKYIYDQCSDWDQRNAAGVEPVLPLLKKFQGVQTLEDFESLIYDDEARMFLPFESNYNSFRIRFQFNKKYVAADLRFSSDFYEKMLLKCGYSKTDAKKLVKIAQDFEQKYSRVKTKMSVPLYKNKPNEELDPYPIRKFMDASGFGEASGILIEWLEVTEAFFSMYNEENLEALKALCICRLMRISADYLDWDCFELKCEITKKVLGKKLVPQGDEYSIEFLNTIIPMLYGKLWLQNFFSEEVREDVTKFVQSILDEYIADIPDWGWLSVGARYNLCQLLKNTKVIAGYSNSFPDYTGLYRLFADKEYSNETLLDTYIKICNFEKAIDVKKSFSEVDDYVWIDPPQTLNAYYNPGNNSINLFAGWIWASGYDVNMSIEEKMAKIGTVMAHEISHSFSNPNLYQTTNGHHWNNADSEALNSKLNVYAKYLHKFTLLNGKKCDGELVKFEAGADMFGMTLVLNMAKKIPDFDYQKFFINYSYVWCSKFTRNFFESFMLKDSHPAHFLRVNAEVQQFDEFYEAFDIKPGDKMYLPPKKRIRF